MAEEKSIIEILDRQIQLIKEQTEIANQIAELSKKQMEVQDELDAIQEPCKIHLKAQKEMHKTVFDKRYAYDKKGKSYAKTE